MILSLIGKSDVSLSNVGSCTWRLGEDPFLSGLLGIHELSQGANWA
jgi:hypothetical protein